MANFLKRAAHVVMGFGAVGTVAEAEGSYHGYEAPNYTVARVIGDAELRQYDSYIVAEVTVRGAQSRALSQGFGVLAGYIFGGNTSQSSVAMTTPVAQRPSETIAMTTPVGQSGNDGVWTVTFTMPSDYTIATLPTPKTDAIRFVEVAPAVQFVLRFSGRASTDSINLHDAQLRKLAEAEGITLEGAPSYYFYDDPMTLPWNRRNEVAYVVSDASSKSPG